MTNRKWYAERKRGLLNAGIGNVFVAILILENLLALSHADVRSSRCDIIETRMVLKFNIHIK